MSENCAKNVNTSLWKQKWHRRKVKYFITYFDIRSSLFSGSKFTGREGHSSLQIWWFSFEKNTIIAQDFLKLFLDLHFISFMFYFREVCSTYSPPALVKLSFGKPSYKCNFLLSADLYLALCWIWLNQNNMLCFLTILVPKHPTISKNASYFTQRFFLTYIIYIST